MDARHPIMGNEFACQPPQLFVVLQKKLVEVQEGLD
jgi:hypothetical protein